MGGVPAYWCRYEKFNEIDYVNYWVCTHASAAEIRAWAKQDLPTNGRIRQDLIKDYFISRVSKLEKIPIADIRSAIVPTVPTR